MADPAVATKAPESDAREDVSATTSLVAGEALAQTGPTMGEHCVTDRPTPSGQGPTGEVVKLKDIDIYLSKPSDYPHSSARLLLLLTGGTGMKSINNQIQADRFASEGYVVVMPDLFDGDVAPNSTAQTESDASGQEAETLNQTDADAASFLDTIKIKAAETAKSFLIDMWLARHTQEKVIPILCKVIEGCQDEFADAASSGGGIYAVGYCFGARYVLLLASEHAANTFGTGLASTTDESGNQTSTSRSLIKAGAVAHPTMVSTEDFADVKVPLTLVLAENDPMFPDDVRKAGEGTLTKDGVEYEVQIYPGVPHGFAVVGDYEDVKIQGAQKSAYEQILKWLKAH